MFCKRCGAELPNDTLFCPLCGTQVSDAARRAAEQATPPSPLEPRPKPIQQPVATQPVAPRPAAPQVNRGGGPAVRNQPAPQVPTASYPPQAARPAPMPGTQTNAPAASAQNPALRIVEGVLGIVSAVCLLVLPFLTVSVSMMGYTESEGASLLQILKAMVDSGAALDELGGSVDIIGGIVDFMDYLGQDGTGLLSVFFVLLIALGLGILLSLVMGIVSFVSKSGRTNPLAFGPAVCMVVIIVTLFVLSSRFAALEQMGAAFTIGAGPGVWVALVCGIGMGVLEIVRHK